MPSQTGSIDLTSQVAANSNAIDVASKTATNYITADSNGIKIHMTDNSTTYQHQSATGTNFYVNSLKRSEVGGEGLKVYIGDTAGSETEVGHFGEYTRIGDIESSHTTISPLPNAGVAMYDETGSTRALRVATSGLYIGSDDTAHFSDNGFTLFPQGSDVGDVVRLNAGSIGTQRTNITRTIKLEANETLSTLSLSGAPTISHIYRNTTELVKGTDYIQQTTTNSGGVDWEYNSTKDGHYINTNIVFNPAITGPASIIIECGVLVPQNYYMRMGPEWYNHTVIDDEGFRVINYNGDPVFNVDMASDGTSSVTVGEADKQHMILDATGLSAYDENGDYAEIKGIVDGENIKPNTVTAHQINTENLVVGISQVENLSNSMAWQGTCATAAGTAAKAVTCAGFTLNSGATITVRFTTANTSAAALTLNVNSTGAKTIYAAGAATAATNQLLWAANATISFTYDGTYWRVTGEPRNWYGTCTIAATTAAKTAAINEVVLCKGSTVNLQMTNANAVANPTLNITSLGAKDIYTANAKLTATDPNNWFALSTIPFVFDGQNFRYDSEASSKVNNVEVGGRNLLKKSQLNPSNWTHSYPNSTRFEGDGYENLWTMVSTSSFEQCYLEVPVEIGASYMLSLECKVDKAYNIYSAGQRGVCFQVLSATPPNSMAKDIELCYIEFPREVSSYERKTASFTPATSSVFFNINGGFIADGASSANTPIHINYIKLEKGTKATDWTPAPEDQTAYVDSIQIGGRNLFTWPLNGTKWKDEEHVLNTYQNRGSFTQFTGSLLFDPSETVGEQYTISFWAKSPNGTTGLQVYNSNSNPKYFWIPQTTLTTALDNEWKFFSLTVTNTEYNGGNTPSTDETYWRRIEIYAPNAIGVLVKQIKVEKGTKATDWTPAPEDIDSAIAGKAELTDATEYIVGTQTAATGSWTGVTRDSSLYTGKKIAYKLPYNGSGNASLQLKDSSGNNVGGNIAVYLGTTRMTTHFGAGSVIQMVYDGTYWRATSIPNTNNIDRRLHNNYILAVEAVASGALACATSAGYKQVKASQTFDMSYPILWAGGAWAANTQYANAYEAIPSVNPATTGTVQNVAKNAAVYLKGTINGNTFTCASSNFLTCTVPTSADNFFYIPLGIVANNATTQMYFSTSRDLYAFIDGKFRQVTPTEIVSTHRIYYRSASATKPSAPSSWIAEATGNVYNQWTTKVPPLAANITAGQTKYLYLYTCEQRQRLDGTLNCTTVQLDENTTVIDGGNIITGSVMANKLNAVDINASNSLTIGALSTSTQNNILNSNVVVGGKNLLLDSASRTNWQMDAPTSYGIATIRLSENLVKGEQYTLQVWGTVERSDKDNSAIFNAYWGGGNVALGAMTPNAERNYWTLTFTAPNTTHATADNAWLNLYNTVPAGASGTTYSSNILKVKLERGNRPTDWTPAPEDVQSDVDSKADQSTVNDMSFDLYGRAADADEGVEAIESIFEKISNASREAIEHADSIEKSIKDNFAETLGDYVTNETYSSDVTDLNNNIKDSISELSADVDQKYGDTKETIKKISGYIRITDDPLLELGSNDANAKVAARLTNTELDFDVENAGTVAYIGTDGEGGIMGVTRANIGELNIGNNWQFQQRANGHLSLKHISLE